MNIRSNAEDEFLQWYDINRDSLQKGCSDLVEVVEELLADGKVIFHTVHARVKERDSIIRKIRSKEYTQPTDELTDVVALRIYTYFREDTPSVEEVIRSRFNIDEKRSVDKASILKPMEFGYTSRHLICRIGEKTQDLRLKKRLNDIWFEVQIRTVLEHAWAEIEHELVYKAQTDVPDLIRRRFNATAAALEIVDREFAQLRQFEKELIREHSGSISMNSSQKLNRTWFFACLSAAFPSPVTWDPDPKRNAFYRNKEVGILENLADNGIATVHMLQTLLDDPRTKKAVERYAALKNVSNNPPSHLVVSLVACVLAGKTISSKLSKLFDDELREAVDTVLNNVSQTNEISSETDEIS